MNETMGENNSRRYIPSVFEKSPKFTALHGLPRATLTEHDTRGVLSATLERPCRTRSSGA